MMKVYVAVREIEYEGGDVLGVYATPQAAWQKLRLELLADYSGEYEDRLPEDTSKPGRSSEAGLTTYCVEEWEVKP